MKKTLIISALIIFIVACGNMNKLSKKDNVTIPGVILTNDFSSYSRESSETQITNAIINDSILTLKVNYSGGCKDHEFQLIGSKMIQKSLPPIRNIMLAHNSKSDDCREFIEQELKFNISDFKYPNSDIILNLKGYKPKILFYNY
jgi:hypothetical protein